MYAVACSQSKWQSSPRSLQVVAERRPPKACSRAQVELRLLPVLATLLPFFLDMATSTSLVSSTDPSSAPQQLLILSGVIGSGKSTFSQALVKQIPVCHFCATAELRAELIHATELGSGKSGRPRRPESV